MTPSSRILRVWALLTAHSRVFSGVLVAVLILGALAAILGRSGFEFNPLGLLPAGDPEVEALRYYALSFDSSDLLVFWCHSSPSEATAGDRFVAYLADALQKETWVNRVLDRDPRTTVVGRQQAEKIVPWLLLNRPAVEFRDAMERLEPNARRDQITRFKEKNQSDGEDPTQLLGLLRIGLAPLESANAVRLPVSWEPGSGIRLIYVEPTDAAKSGGHWLHQVKRFLRNAEKNWSGYRPVVRVLGRTTLIQKSSLKNWQDFGIGILVSFLGSACLLAIAYQRCGVSLTGPVIGLMALLLAAGVFGIWFGRFDELSFGFAPILMGVVAGQTALLFSLHRFASAIADKPSDAMQLALACGADLIWLLTGAIGLSLICLLLAAPPVLTHFLWQLILGLFIGAPLSIFFSLAWTRESSGEQKPAAERVLKLPLRWSRWAVVVCGIALLIGIPLFVLHFKRPIRLVTPTEFFGPTSWLEPFRLSLRSEQSPEAILLTQLPRGETDKWETLEQDLDRAVVAGQIAGFSSPVAFFWSPQRLLENKAFLLHYDFKALRASYENELESNGLDLDDFRAERDLLSAFAEISRDPNPPDWSHLFPPDSGWKMLLDQYVSVDRKLAACFIRFKIDGQTRLASLLPQIDSEAKIVVWPTFFWRIESETVVRCVLALCAAGVGLLVLLCIFYRDWALFCVHVFSLALGVGLLLSGVAALAPKLDLYGLLVVPIVVCFSAGCGAAFVRLRQLFPEQPLLRSLLPFVVAAISGALGFGVLAFRQHSVWQTLGAVGAAGIAAELLAMLLFFVPALEVFRLVRPKGR